MVQMLSYPPRAAARQRSYTVASVKRDSPSERNITTGVLQGCHKYFVFQMKYSLPLRCGVPLHDFSSTCEGIVVVSPQCRGVIQKKLDQLLCSASGVVLSNDLEKEVRRSPIGRVSFTSAVALNRTTLYVS